MGAVLLVYGRQLSDFGPEGLIFGRKGRRCFVAVKGHALFAAARWLRCLSPSKPCTAVSNTFVGNKIFTLPEESEKIQGNKTIRYDNSYHTIRELGNTLT